MEKKTEYDVETNKRNQDVVRNEKQANVNLHKEDTVKSEKLRFKNADELYE